MLKKTAIALALASTISISTPSYAGGWWGGSSGGTCKWRCGSSTSGGSSSSGGSTSSGGSSGGHQVPEPGMLGMFGLGLVGLALARRHRSRKD